MVHGDYEATNEGEKSMRRIITITQLTVHGVMQAPGGPEEDPTNGFTHGGWAMPFGDETLQQGETPNLIGSEPGVLRCRRDLREHL